MGRKTQTACNLDKHRITTKLSRSWPENPRVGSSILPPSHSEIAHDEGHHVGGPRRSCHAERRTPPQITPHATSPDPATLAPRYSEN
jgi:hypothetical protein